MLSRVLKSEIAIKINIVIIRTFVKARQFSLNYPELKIKIEKIE